MEPDHPVDPPQHRMRLDRPRDATSSIGEPSNVGAALSRISEPWQPHLLATVNDHDVKIAKLRGEFVWHTHPDTDELFLVVEGDLTIQLRDRDVALGPGDVFVVPQGVEHCPKAENEVSAILLELRGTLNTGDAGGDLTFPIQDLPSASPPSAD
jgi:mannose-6-phosphate isomerase-like protein (cupin superfamily)